jgi:hypothetical protein
MCFLSGFRSSKEGQIFTDAAEYDSCKMYVPINGGLNPLTSEAGSGGCIASNFSPNETQTCESYVWARNFIKESITTELDLVGSQ